MTLSRKKLGVTGEELASQFLIQKGYRILARNLKTRYGEIDVLALDGNVTVFVEVKTKTSHIFGLPAEMVTMRKQNKLRLLAETVASEKGILQYRIDVVAISLLNSHQPIIEHLIAAV